MKRDWTFSSELSVTLTAVIDGIGQRRVDGNVVPHCLLKLTLESIGVAKRCSVVSDQGLEATAIFC